MKILLYAFLDGNFGDDLFIKIICERYPHVDFYIIEEDISAFRGISNLHPSKKLKEAFLKLKKEAILKNYLKFNIPLLKKEERDILLSFDASVYIVGSAFMQKSKNKDYSNLLLLDKMVTYSKKFFMINTNFGPYFDERYLIKSENIIKKMEDICFRDKYSYDLFKKYPNVRYASDIVLSLKEKTTIRSDIVISVMNKDETYINFIIKAIQVLKSKNIPVKLVAFCKNQEDDKAIEKIKETVDVASYTYSNNLEDIIRIFKEARGVIATRFHAMILGFAFYKRCLPLIYNKKMIEVIRDAGFKGIYLDINKLKGIDVNEIIDDFLNDTSIIDESYMNISLDQFLGLDKFIGDRYEV